MTRANFGSGALMVADNKLIILDNGELIIAGATPEKCTARARAQFPRPSIRSNLSVVLVETSHVPFIGDDDADLSLFESDASTMVSLRTPSLFPAKAPTFKSLRRPRVRGKDVAIPLIPPTVEEPGKHYIIALPDEEHELVVRYTQKELIATVRRKGPPPLPTNQLELKLE